MQTHPTNDTAMTAIPAPSTMLRHLFTSCRKMHLHLTAYSEATAKPELVSKDDVPDYEYYDFAADRAATDEMLRMSKELLDHLEQHRSSYYSSQPAFEQPTVNTSYEGISPRLHNAGEAALWVIAAHQISLTYAETLPTDNPAHADAQKLAEEVDNLLGTMDEHGNEHTLSRGTHPATWFEADASLDEMHPIYTELSTERANRD